MKKLQPIQSGITGEYFVAAELSKRGYTASLTLKNTEGIDILVSNKNGTEFIGIQVKTKQDAKKVWLLNKKNETFYSDKLYYVFVDIKTDPNSEIDYHIVPSKIVCEYIKENHKKFLRTPKKDGKPRKDTTMREFKDKGNKYLNCWDILKL